MIGLGKKENFAASDPLALAELTKNFLIMEDGDVARISSDQVEIYDEQDKLTNREELSIDVNAEASSKGASDTTWKKKYLNSLALFLIP